MFNWRMLAAIIVVLSVVAGLFGGVVYFTMEHFFKDAPVVVITEKLDPRSSWGLYTAAAGDYVYYFDSRQEVKGIYRMNQNGGNPDLVQPAEEVSCLTVNGDSIFYYVPRERKIYMADRNLPSKIRQERILAEDNTMLPRYRINSLFASDSTLYSNEAGGFFSASCKNISAYNTYTNKELKKEGNTFVLPIVSGDKVSYSIFDDNTKTAAPTQDQGGSMLINMPDCVVYAMDGEVNELHGKDAKTVVSLQSSNYTHYSYINEIEFFAFGQSYTGDEKRQSTHNDDVVVRFHLMGGKQDEVFRSGKRERIVAVKDYKAYIFKWGYIEAFDLVTKEYVADYKYTLPEFDEDDRIAFEPCGGYIFVYNTVDSELVTVVKML